MKRFLLLFLFCLTGCTVVSHDRVFPKLAFYWSHDAKLEREYRRRDAAFKAGDTNWFNVK